MESEKFFSDKDFNNKWKGKSGIYIIENQLFTKYVGYPTYKVGYARYSLATRIRDYKTAYGLVPFRIHAIYEIPEKIIGKRVNYAHLTERVLQETARKYGEWSGVGEWYKDLPLLLNILFTIREKHLKEIKKANNWEFYTYVDKSNSLNKIDLVDEKVITGTFKDLVAGRTTRSGDNEPEDDYEVLIKNKNLHVPTTYINAEGEEDDI